MERRAPPPGFRIRSRRPLIAWTGDTPISPFGLLYPRAAASRRQ